MDNAIQLEKIRIDGGTQSRVEIDAETVAEYAAVNKREWKKFPPVQVWFDGKDYLLTDGFHRCEAAKKRGDKSIHCKVWNGEAKHAVLAAAGANQKHGRRRTNADKRNAVLMLLSHEHWTTTSNRFIADHCGVSPGMVDELRKQLPAVGSSDAPRTGKDGKVRKQPISRPKTVTEKSSSPSRSTEPVVTDTAPAPCPNCGSIDRDDDGDCSQCHDPCPEEKTAAPLTLKSGHRIIRDKEQAIDREPVCAAISQAATSTVATNRQPQLGELYERLKSVAGILGSIIADDEKLVAASQAEHWNCATITEVQSTVSAIAHDFKRVERLLRRVHP